MNRFFLLGVAALLCGTSGTLVRGQDSVLAELYGQGVHSYFSGDYFTAKDLFTNAIAQGSKDPRVFYFRGLTYQRIGRVNEGEADLKLGALLEANSTERIYPVSDSLQRIQGRMRLQIEKQRQQARLVTRGKQNQAEQARYQQMERSDPNAGRKPNVSPPAAAPATPVEPDKTDPFANDAEAKPEPAPAKPAAVAEPKPEASDPFGTATPMTTPPAATEEKPADAPADPFGAPAAPTTPPAKDASDPFADDKPAETPPAETPPAETPPAEKPPEKPAADDPFGM